MKKFLVDVIPGPIGEFSDGYHTFNELYHFRLLYNAALFNEWARSGQHAVHKSKRHYDGELCFGGGWFIVCAQLPTGQISNHYEDKYWDYFNIPEHEKSLWAWDEHSAQDVATRLEEYIKTKDIKRKIEVFTPLNFVETLIGDLPTPNVFLAKDNNDVYFVCYLIGDEYVSTAISKRTLDGLLFGSIDLRDVFLKPETRGWCTFKAGFEDILAKDWDGEVLPENFLPKKDSFLKK